MRQPIKKHGSPRRGKGFESHTKTLTQGGLPPESVESFSYDWRRVWDEVEVPHYEGGSRVVGKNKSVSLLREKNTLLFCKFVCGIEKKCLTLHRQIEIGV
jgi:hypothetical protein